MKESKGRSKSDIRRIMSKGIAWPAETQTWREQSTTESGSLLRITWTVCVKQIFARQGGQISRPGPSEPTTAECLNIGVPPKPRNDRWSNEMLRLEIVAKRVERTRILPRINLKKRRMILRKNHHHLVINEGVKQWEMIPVNLAEATTVLPIVLSVLPLRQVWKLTPVTPPKGRFLKIITTGAADREEQAPGEVLEETRIIKIHDDAHAGTPMAVHRTLPIQVGEMTKVITPGDPITPSRVGVMTVGHQDAGRILKKCDIIAEG